MNLALARFVLTVVLCRNNKWAYISVSNNDVTNKGKGEYADY